MTQARLHRSPEAPASTNAVGTLGDTPVTWPALLNEALSMPGQMGNTYNRFKPGGYSFGNQVLLFMQGVHEPVNTYGRWQAMGRQVQRGSKAKSILLPMIGKARNEETGELEQRIRGFKMKACLFGVSETEGDELPEYEPPTWDETRALGALGITKVSFDLLDGDVQGVSHGRNVAVNPVAAEPFPTLLHEISHVEGGHTARDKLAEYVTHRGLLEFEAEGSAYLVLNELDVPEERWDRAESRAYLQSWLRGKIPPDDSIKRVFKIADAILKAGRQPELVENVTE